MMTVLQPIAGSIVLVLGILFIALLYKQQKSILLFRLKAAEVALAAAYTVSVRSRIILCLWGAIVLCFTASTADVAVVALDSDKRCAHTIIIVDVSKSMHAEDASNMRSRKQAMQDHIHALARTCKAGSVGLISFAGFAGWRIPQTEWMVLRDFMDEGRILAYQEKDGSDIGAALWLVAGHVRDSKGDILTPPIEVIGLFSDGGNDWVGMEADLEKKLQALPGVRVLSVGYGRNLPARIPDIDADKPKKRSGIGSSFQLDVGDWDGGGSESYDYSTDSQVVTPKVKEQKPLAWMKDEKGEYYTTALNQKPLRMLAERSKGTYFHESDPQLVSKLREALTMDEYVSSGSVRREFHTPLMLVALLCLTSIIFLASRGGIKE